MGDTLPLPLTVRVSGLTGAKMKLRVARADTLPAPSMLLTRMVFVPAGSVSEADQLVVPVAAVNAPLFNCTSTRSTEMLSLAVPVTVIVALLNLVFAAGEEMTTVGAVRSGGTPRFKVASLLNAEPSTLVTST